MTTIQAQIAFFCAECNKNFDSASCLLQHFALHVCHNEIENLNELNQQKSDKKSVPDLYPINLINKNENSANMNPMTLCSVNMEEQQKKDNKNRKKYFCSFCSKSFGWSTDLKRHLLTHTGERPFKCQFCEANFTRNFLLQKHESKVHSNSSIPNLKPLKKESRKQDKNKIKRKETIDFENGFQSQFETVQ